MDISEQIAAAQAERKAKKKEKRDRKEYERIHEKHKAKKEPIDYLRKQKFSIVTSELFRQLLNFNRKASLSPDEFGGEHERLGEYEGEGYGPKWGELLGENEFKGELDGEDGKRLAEILGELDSDFECPEIPSFYYDEDGKRVEIMRIGSQVKISKLDLKKLLKEATDEAKEDEVEQKPKLEIIPEEILGEGSDILSELSVKEIRGEDSELSDLADYYTQLSDTVLEEPEPDESGFYYDEKGNRITFKRTGSKTRLSRKFLDSLLQDESAEQTELEESGSEESIIYSRPRTASIGGFTGEEDGEDHFVSLIDQYAREYRGKDDDNYRVSVDAEVKQAPSSTKKVKMYNVSLQVRPKDIYRALRKLRPKMYNVQIGVTIIESERRQKLERERAERAKIKREDDSVSAKPRGYKDLDDLTVSLEPEVTSKETQVTDMDLERELAASLGLKLPVNNIIWPTIKDFTPELIELRLEMYIDRIWKLDKEWAYSIRYLQQHTSNYRNKHMFEVMFSIPTMSNPVPIATASVYFIFELGHYANLDEQIKVSYVLEGNRFPFIPGRIPFQQKWLSGLIADKIRIQKGFKFH